MLYTILAYDKDNSLDLRLKTRESHLEYLKKFLSNIIFAGPLLNNDEKPIGSQLILNFDTQTELDSFLQNDPYAVANLFAKTIIHPVKMVINNSEIKV